MEGYARLAERYRTFAADEAQGVSPIYERLARDIADSPDEAGKIAIKGWRCLSSILA